MKALFEKATKMEATEISLFGDLRRLHYEGAF